MEIKWRPRALVRLDAGSPTVVDAELGVATERPDIRTGPPRCIPIRSCASEHI